MAYFTNTISVDAIRGENIALLTDIVVSSGILKTVVLQANANARNNVVDEKRQKKTFLHR